MPGTLRSGEQPGHDRESHTVKDLVTAFDQLYAQLVDTQIEWTSDLEVNAVANRNREEKQALHEVLMLLMRVRIALIDNLSDEVLNTFLPSVDFNNMKALMEADGGEVLLVDKLGVQDGVDDAHTNDASAELLQVVDESIELAEDLQEWLHADSNRDSYYSFERAEYILESVLTNLTKVKDDSRDPEGARKAKFKYYFNQVDSAKGSRVRGGKIGRSGIDATRIYLLLSTAEEILALLDESDLIDRSRMYPSEEEAIGTQVSTVVVEIDSDDTQISVSDLQDIELNQPSVEFVGKLSQSYSQETKCYSVRKVLALVCNDSEFIILLLPRFLEAWDVNVERDGNNEMMVDKRNLLLMLKKMMENKGEFDITKY